VDITTIAGLTNKNGMGFTAGGAKQCWQLAETFLVETLVASQVHYLPIILMRTQ